MTQQSVLLELPLDGELFRVLSADSRREMLRLLQERRMTVAEIAHRLELGKPAVSEHLNKLREAGLVDRNEDPERMWVYFSLSAKGRSLLNPERVRFTLVLGVAAVALALGAAIALGVGSLLEDGGHAQDLSAGEAAARDGRDLGGDVLGAGPGAAAPAEGSDRLILVLPDANATGDGSRFLLETSEFTTLRLRADDLFAVAPAPAGNGTGNTTDAYASFNEPAIHDDAGTGYDLDADGNGTAGDDASAPDGGQDGLAGGTAAAWTTTAATQTAPAMSTSTASMTASPAPASVLDSVGNVALPRQDQDRQETWLAFKPDDVDARDGTVQAKVLRSLPGSDGLRLSGVGDGPPARAESEAKDAQGPSRGTGTLLAGALLALAVVAGGSKVSWRRQ